MKSPFNVTVSLLGDTAKFPAGEYHPLYEDDSGYYFQAPAKIIIVSLGIPIPSDGGIIVERGSKEPTRWFLLDNNSFKRTGSLKRPPSYELIP